MKAGRELDALIAEKVMGLSVHKRRIPSILDDFYYIKHHLSALEDCLVPHYSTKIADAWLVVEEMQAEGWFGSVNITSWKTMPWNVRFWSEHNEKKGYYSTDTAPLAICLAALKAIE